MSESSSVKVLFLHGWQSVPGGLKPSYLRDQGWQILNPALPDEDFAAAVAIAQAEFDRHHPAVVVGSSRGGAVAMNIDAGNAPLVLLCPAWRRWGSVTRVKAQTKILHSPYDDVIPFADSLELRACSGLAPESLIVVGEDHRLADPQSLAAMAAAVRASVGAKKEALVVHRDETPGQDCPFGRVQRIVTGGRGGIANVHVVQITQGNRHLHTGYDEIYYLLSGTGTITLDQQTYPLRPGSVAVIPAGVPHSLIADPGQTLEFIIFGTPPLPMDHPLARPQSSPAPDASPFDPTHPPGS